MSSRALLKFLCRSSISHHSHQTVARSSTYLNATCPSVTGVELAKVNLLLTDTKVKHNMHVSMHKDSMPEA